MVCYSFSNSMKRGVSIVMILKIRGRETRYMNMCHPHISFLGLFTKRV